MEDIFHGELVRLGSDNLQTIAEALSRWHRDSEYARLLDDEPARLKSPERIKEWLEKDLEEGQHSHFFFTIRTLDEDKLIGFIGLFVTQWSHGNSWVGIGLGEREYWGKGYGTDAMRLILRYAFRELNLHRVSLGVFEYNPRAMRAYEKAGFQPEGRARKVVYREGLRRDIIHMGILRDEWEELMRNIDASKNGNLLRFV